MSPRKASLRVAHSTKCANKTKTALESTGRGSGCTCQPSYYVFQRDRDGQSVKGPRVKDRQAADRALTKAQREIDEGRADVRRPQRVTLGEWIDEYEKQLGKRVDRGELKQRTHDAYRETNAHAKVTIGTTVLREIGAPELRRFDDGLPTMGRASRDRHLRHLGACLSAAVDDGKLDRNPVSAFRHKRNKRLPARPKRGKAPFEDGELVAIWQALEPDEPVFLYASQLAVETGMRLGELAALDWPNVTLGGDKPSVYVEHTWDPKYGLTAPKGGEPRHIYLTREARAVLERWVAVTGARDEGPVFPNPSDPPGERLSLRWLERAFERATQEAGVPKIHPELRLPRSFHSTRYSTSNVMQRRGYHPRLIEQTLGHGSLELTYGVYGGWTPEQLAAEAARVAPVAR